MPLNAKVLSFSHRFMFQALGNRSSGRADYGKQGMEHPSLSGLIAQEGEPTSLKLIKQTCLNIIHLGWYWNWAPLGPQRWDSPY